MTEKLLTLENYGFKIMVLHYHGQKLHYFSAYNKQKLTTD